MKPAASPENAGAASVARGFTPAQRRQFAFITVGALAVFAIMRWLPTGTNLNHMDFRVDAKNPIDFCDPLNPQFIPVVAVASPVSLTLSDVTGAVAGKETQATLTLRTASGKPIAPADLVVTHTELLHLLIADPTLTDYQHVHPRPAAAPGAWTFRFTPRRAGAYRIFADFTPVATNRGLYANTDLTVAGGTEPVPATAPNTWAVERDGYRFALVPAALPLRVNQVVDLKFVGQRHDGGRVPLAPVMGAFAHLVAFDAERSGFAHLHPMELDVTQPPDALKPVLNFKITFPRPGRYVIWAQIDLGGTETFLPYWFDVAG
jgi:hypothetical protein